MGGIAQTLAHIGNRMREDHLLDLQDKKSQQDRSLDWLKAASQNPGVRPESQQKLFELGMQAMTTPLDKWDHKKISKGIADIISQDHDLSVQGAQQQSEQQPANLSFPIPGGNYDAGGFESHPPMAPAAPPGQPQLPTAALPEPPQYRASGPAQVPGMPTAMEMPGIAAPGPEVPGAVQPFISAPRAWEQDVKRLEALAPARAMQRNEEYDFRKSREEEEVKNRIEDLKREIDPATGKSIWELMDPIQRANVRVDAKRLIEQRTTTPSDIKEGNALD